MITAYIGLGSNQQHPKQQLSNAIDALRELPQSKLLKVSSMYRSRALGDIPQDDYYNAVVSLETTLEPQVLLEELQTIENAQGRVRIERWGPRTLDLDLLLYGNQIIETPTLSVPHPRMHERDFVLYPLREISDTDLRLPDGTTLETLINACADNDLVRLGQ